MRGEPREGPERRTGLTCSHLASARTPQAAMSLKDRSRKASLRLIHHLARGEAGVGQGVAQREAGRLRVWFGSAGRSHRICQWTEHMSWLLTESSMLFRLFWLFCEGVHALFHQAPTEGHLNCFQVLLFAKNHVFKRGFSGGSDDKESAYSARDPGSFHPWARKIPRRREGQPTPVFFPGEFHGQRSLAGYSPRGHKELDTTEQPTQTHTCN